MKIRLISSKFQFALLQISKISCKPKHHIFLINLHHGKCKNKFIISGLYSCKLRFNFTASKYISHKLLVRTCKFCMHLLEYGMQQQKLNLFLCKFNIPSCNFNSRFYKYPKILCKLRHHIFLINLYHCTYKNKFIISGFYSCKLHFNFTASNKLLLISFARYHKLETILSKYNSHYHCSTKLSSSHNKNFPSLTMHKNSTNSHYAPLQQRS